MRNFRQIRSTSLCYVIRIPVNASYLFHFRRRQTVYKYMLKHMTDEQKFNLTSRLVQDVLGGFADETLRLNAMSGPVLQDALIVLSTKVILLNYTIF